MLLSMFMGGLKVNIISMDRSGVVIKRNGERLLVCILDEGDDKISGMTKHTIEGPMWCFKPLGVV